MRSAASIPYRRKAGTDETFISVETWLVQVTVVVSTAMGTTSD